MHFDTFVELTRRWWFSYLERVAQADAQGRLDRGEAHVLYPNILLVTKFPNHFIAELMGAASRFDGLTVKHHRERSIDRYFSQFNQQAERSLIFLDKENVVISGGCLSTSHDFDIVSKRFPQIELYRSRLVADTPDGAQVLRFGPNFVSTALLDCILVNQGPNVSRCKSILATFIFSRSCNRDNLEVLYRSATRYVQGVHFATGERERRMALAGQFQSLYLQPDLRETTIGEFIHRNPDLVKTALKTESFVYEPLLEWKEHGGLCPDVAINPDLMIQRADGYFDIYDLKTAKQSAASLTKGGFRRRRFIDYVHEGVAQLANYREYFSYKANARLADEKYGIRVSNPKLVLVVGSWENAETAEIGQALRAHSEDIQIIDFDTFCQFFLGAD